MSDVDTSDYVAIHTSIRSGAYALAEAAATLRAEDHDRMGAFARYWHGYVGEVLTHHGIEDDIFFPALRARCAEAADVLDQLDQEHHVLDDLMDRSADAIAAIDDGGSPAEAAEVLRRFADVMDDHLDLEDRAIVPRFVELFSGDEYEAMTKAAIKATGIGRQALFTVPFVAYWVTDEQRDMLLGMAPLPFRIMYRLTRTRHARLAALALGSASRVPALV
ncbi:MAG: hemerythrin domain-containing protein [Ilumatobacteraceae bacterium]